MVFANSDFVPKVAADKSGIADQLSCNFTSDNVCHGYQLTNMDLTSDGLLTVVGQNSSAVSKTSFSDVESYCLSFQVIVNSDQDDDDLTIAAPFGNATTGAILFSKHDFKEDGSKYTFNSIRSLVMIHNSINP